MVLQHSYLMRLGITYDISHLLFVPHSPRIKETIANGKKHVFKTMNPFASLARETFLLLRK